MKQLYATAISNFVVDDNLEKELQDKNCQLSLLPLIAGDRICVLGHKEEWSYGYKLEKKDHLGLFPSNHLLLERNSNGAEFSSEGSDLVNEIDAAVHRWWSRLKELYSKQCEIHYFDKVLDKMDELLAERKKLLSDGVPTEELKSLRIRIAKTIDHVNLLLSLNVTIRKENGAPLDVESISIIRNYKEHLNSTKANEKAGDCEYDNKLDNFSIMFSVQSIELFTQHHAEISFAFFDIDKKVYVSECFSFFWKGRDSKQASRDLNMQAIVANFTKEDVKRRVVLICRIAQIAPIDMNATLKKNVDCGPMTSYCRQLLGFSFLDLEYIFSKPMATNDPKEMVIFMNKSQDFDQAFKSLIVTSRVPKFDTSDDVKLLISTQVYAGTVNELQQHHPHLFPKDRHVVVRRADLPAEIGDNCNYLYITLHNGEFPGKADKNIELRMSIHYPDGVIDHEKIERVGITESNILNEYRSYVVMHSDKPYWLEHFRIRLPERCYQDIHLKITAHSRKAKQEKGPFALAYLNILQSSSLVKTEELELLVYKIENAQYDAKNTSYLSLPYSRKVLKDVGNTTAKPHSNVFSLSEKSVIKLSTHVCSSVLSQNESIVNVLRWKTNDLYLNGALSELSVPVGDTEGEMMRFLCPLLDALFEIWDVKEQLELPVFNVIIIIFQLVDEPRFAKAAKILDEYMERFHFPSAALKLLRCLHHYIESAATTNNDKTRTSFKVIGRLFVTIVCSKKCGIQFSDDPMYGTNIYNHLDSVLKAIVGLMSETKERMAIQNTALKHLPSIINPIVINHAYNDLPLCNFITSVMNSFGKNIVARERLGFVAQLVETKLFDLWDCRNILLPKCLEMVLFHLDPDMADEKDFPERALECVNILSHILERLFPTTSHKNQEYSVLGTDEELVIIIDLVYRPVVRALVHIDLIQGPNEQNRGKIFSLILALLNKMSAQMFDNYLRSRPTLIDKTDFLLEMVQMIRDLLTRCPFSDTWQQMIMAQNKIIHKALRFVMSAIQSYFLKENFSPPVWEEYMLTIVCLVTQPSLQVDNEWMRDETDPRIQLRKTTAKELRSIWFMLSPSKKMKFIPRLVGAFLKVALIEDEETRDATIPIFFDMMQAEYHSHVEGRDVRMFTDELISTLDTLINENCGTKAFQEKFTSILTSQCQSDVDLWNDGGQELIQQINDQLQYLLEYRQVRENEDCIENIMSRTFQLMKYYESYGHMELYITYVYKLYTLHINNNSEVEAAKTLILHANLLTWREVELPDWLVSRCLNRHCATERQLKDQLLQEVATLYSAGSMWEDAIQILNELVPVYEKMYVDYNRLAELLVRIAELYRMINDKTRTFFYFYLVAFYGKGFPNYLNGQRFVFRSNNLERLSDFLERMKQIYGGPETLPSMDDCSEYVTKPGRYIQIFNVDPISTACPFDEDIDVNPSIKDYYRHFNISNFEYNRLIERKETKWTEVEDSEVMRTWIVKNRLLTKDTLPSVLRFSKVLRSPAQILISPLRRAVDQMELKNEQLFEDAQLLLQNPSTDVKKISGSIMGVVRANVQGGIRNYEVFFDERCSKIYESEEKQLAMRLSALIIIQVEILEFCLYAHAMRVDAPSAPLHEHMVNGFLEHKSYVEERFGKTRSILPPDGSIHLSVPTAAGSSGDIGPASTGTLISRGTSAMLSFLSPARRSINPQTSFSSTMNNPLDTPTNSTFYDKELPGTLRNIRRQTTATTIDGIQMRPSRDSTIPPPLPPRS